MVLQYGDAGTNTMYSYTKIHTFFMLLICGGFIVGILKIIPGIL